MVDIPSMTPNYYIPRRFQGKTLLVTGAATGIGAATAIRAAREGANVVCVDCKERKLQITLSKIKFEGHNAIAVVADVSKTEDTDRMLTEAVKAYGSIDLALNAASVIDGCNPTQLFDLNTHGHLLPNSIHEATDEYWDSVVATNTTGTFKSLRAELRQMLQQNRGGAIVNIGSIACLTGLPGNPAYMASKYAVTGLTRNAAIEYAPYGIRINSVNIAQIDTSIVVKDDKLTGARQKSRNGNSFDGLKTQTLLNTEDSKHSSANLWEQTAPILFLLSDDASDLTGCVCTTDGGWTDD